VTRDEAEDLVLDLCCAYAALEHCMSWELNRLRQDYHELYDKVIAALADHPRQEAAE